MTKGLLKSTTMLALAASLAMPAAAQSNNGADCAKTPDAPACAPENAQQKGDQAKAKQSKGEEKPGKAKKAEADAAAETGKDAGGKQAKSHEQPAATQTAEEPTEDAPKAKAGASAEADAAQGKKAKQAQKASEPGIAEGEASTAAAAEPKLDAETQATEQAPEQTQDARTADSQPKSLKAQQDAEAKTQAPKADSEEAAPAASAAGAAAATEQTAPADGDVASDDLAKKLEAQQDGTVEAEGEPKPKAQQTTEAPTAAEAAPAPKADAQAETTAETKAETKSGGDVKAEDLANELGGKDPEAQDAPRAADSQQAEPEQTAAEQTGQQPAAEQEAPKQQSAEAQAEAVARQDKQEAKVAAAAASESDSSDAELTEETLTDADVRSSDEDFATDLQSRQEADTQNREKRVEKDDDDDEDGLSNFEKAALLGLGTFALSQMIGDDAQVVQNTGDRVVVEENGQYRVLRNDDVLLRQPGSDVKTYRYDDGSTRTVVAYDDGTTVETIKAADGRVLRRARILPDGQQVMLFDDTQQAQDVVVSELPQARTQRLNFRDLQGEDLAAALAAQEAEGVNRAFSLNQIRNIDRVRHLVPEISVDTVTFPTNSAAIRPGEAEELAALGNAMKRMIEQNPSEVFLIEGHTDATGSASYNLALSDRRAESVALALTEYFDVPPSNMVLQGYGESDLAVQSQGDERENRRAAVRRITTLLQGD